MTNELVLKVCRTHKDAIIPSKREEDSGYDLYAIIEEEFLLIKPGEGKLLPTGLKVEFPKGYGFVIANRGSVGSKGLIYGAHIVDSGYRGEVFININNVSKNNLVITDLNSKQLDKLGKFDAYVPFESIHIIPKSKPLVQALLIPTLHFIVKEVQNEDELLSSARGEGKLGSTDKGGIS